MAWGVAVFGWSSFCFVLLLSVFLVCLDKKAKLDPQVERLEQEY